MNLSCLFLQTQLGRSIAKHLRQSLTTSMLPVLKSFIQTTFYAHYTIVQQTSVSEPSLVTALKVYCNSMVWLVNETAYRPIVIDNNQERQRTVTLTVILTLTILTLILILNPIFPTSAQTNCRCCKPEPEVNMQLMMQIFRDVTHSVRW